MMNKTYYCWFQVYGKAFTAFSNGNTNQADQYKKCIY